MKLIGIVRPDPRVVLKAQIKPVIDPRLQDIYGQVPELYDALNELTAAAEGELLKVLESQVGMLHAKHKIAISNYNARLVAEYANREITPAEKRLMTGEFLEAVMRHSARKDRRELIRTAMQKDAHETTVKLCKDALPTGPSAWFFPPSDRILPGCGFSLPFRVFSVLYSGFYSSVILPMPIDSDGIPVLTDADKTKYLVDYLRFLSAQEREEREKRNKRIRAGVVASVFSVLIAGSAIAWNRIGSDTVGRPAEPTVPNLPDPQPSDSTAPAPSARNEALERLRQRHREILESSFPTGVPVNPKECTPNVWETSITFWYVPSGDSTADPSVPPAPAKSYGRPLILR